MLFHGGNELAPDVKMHKFADVNKLKLCSITWVTMLHILLQILYMYMQKANYITRSLQWIL